jgi:type VII secretion integral membrane protein EccD
METQVVPAPAARPGRVCVTVTSGTRRVDLALPAAVSLVELVPDLARCVAVLDVATAHGGFRVTTRDGRVLRTDLGLTAQGVEHGEVLTVSAGADDETPWAYDDVVEAMTFVVERDVEHWSPAARRRTTLWSAVALLVVGAAGVLTQPGSGPASTTAAVLAATLVISAVLFSQLRGDAVAAVTVGNLGCVCAAIAGLRAGHGAWPNGAAVALAGGGASAAGLVAALGVGRARLLLAPAVVVGAVWLTTGLLMENTSLEPAPPLTALLALVVLASSAFPGLALTAGGTGRHVLSGIDAMPDVEQRGIDLAQIAEDARLARQVLISASATAGFLIAALAPMAVSCGPVGFAVPVLGCAVVMLRTRRYRAALDVLVGVGSGVLGIMSTVVAMLWLDHEWRFPAAVVVVVAGFLLLARVLRSHEAPPRHGRLGDRIEAGASVALLPVLALALAVERL